jgi:hypothetical protein
MLQLLPFRWTFPYAFAGWYAKMISRSGGSYHLFSRLVDFRSLSACHGSALDMPGNRRVPALAATGLFIDEVLVQQSKLEGLCFVLGSVTRDQTTNYHSAPKPTPGLLALATTGLLLIRVGFFGGFPGVIIQPSLDTALCCCGLQA